MTGYFRTS